MASVSIHARWGARDIKCRSLHPHGVFQFTRAGERATTLPVNIGQLGAFQFTRAGERATDGGGDNDDERSVSIHARWGARDCSSTTPPASPRTFQFTRAGERATPSRGWKPPSTRFNSRALGSARLGRRRGGRRLPDVSIHARWGARDKMGLPVAIVGEVSIHARWGARDRLLVRSPRDEVFQFTRAGERATGPCLAPLGGEGGFNSRALGSARPGQLPHVAVEVAFQFTRAGERATHAGCNRQMELRFNSRALGSARPEGWPTSWTTRCFNSRALGSARHRRLITYGLSIHARWGARDTVSLTKN